FQWRRFNFFDKEPVKDPATDQIFDQLKDVNVSACTSGRGQLIVGDFEGNLYFINRQMELTAFRAYEIRVTHLLQLKQHNLLISIGEDEPGINPLIKVWNLEKMERGNPACTRLTRAIPGNKPTPVSAFTVHENLNFMAVGFENGIVLLYKGDVTRERHSKSRIVYEGNKCVTGLAFKTQGKQDLFLFVVTENSTVAINLTAKDQQTLLENTGASIGCITMSDASQDNQLVIGRQDLYQLQEKDTQSKLEMLFKKNNYALAISLAKSQQLDQDGLIDIFTQYGDHLYSKGDHDGAIDQYIKTIGKLEASYVIRKFLDAQRIHNLTKYLQALHMSQTATEEHTTLLLNCYTKLKDVSKLDEFIMTKNRAVDFDVETAINVCRQSGYCAHALALAEKHRKHEHYLKIQIEDIKDYQKALQYIGKLDFESAESNLKQYGKVLMNEVPKQTTELLKRLCTDYKPTDKPLIDQNSLDGTLPSKIQKANAEEFIHIFVNNSSKLTEFLEHMIEVQPNSSNLVYNTLLELYLHDMVHEKDISTRVDRERKTLDLLKNPDANYDIDQALILCQMNNFKAGILYLYEKAHLYQQILRYHMEHLEHLHVIETCKKFGQQDPQLWIQALSYFACKEEYCKSQLMEVLSHIDKKNLLPPLMVIQILAHHSTATLSVVKDYIVRHLQLENDQIAEDERLIKQYREDTEKKRTKIEELKTSAKVFQASKCNICSHSLELPSVHFLCEPHSYHQHCFESYAENDMECPVCAPENRKIMDIIRAQEQSKDIHEFFHNQLERAPDGFSVVADYFGRGVFNKVTLITDQHSKTSNASTR
uniref:Vacuolar protein sorting-associated protein 11 homolog n=1 Tax=Biomphalaria glabrata TaxID=6526 RepID=A0A2C9MAP2_BIOGL